MRMNKRYDDRDLLILYTVSSQITEHYWGLRMCLLISSVCLLNSGSKVLNRNRTGKKEVFANQKFLPISREFEYIFLTLIRKSPYDFFFFFFFFFFSFCFRLL